MVVILAVALLLLMTPIWMHFALEVSGGAACSMAPLQPSCVETSDRTVWEMLLWAGHLRRLRAG